MCLVTKEFEKYLALYGADIEKWPEDIRAKARQVQKQFDTAKLAANYREHARRFEPHHPSLAERIILNAKQHRRNVPVNVLGWLSGLFSDFMIPRPAYALAAMLVLGIGIGLNTPNNDMQDETSISSNFTDDGATL